MSNDIKEQSESNKSEELFEKEIKPITTNLKSLFNSGKKYIIPGYQRPYEWKQEQLKSVVETIQKAIDEEKEYCVFGTIQLNKTKDGKYEIIDGQQRLVTFWLLLNLCCKEEMSSDSWNFEVKNQIDEIFDEQFKNFKEADKSGVYGKNYKDLGRIIKDGKRKEFSSFLIEKVVFVSVETDFEDKETSTQNTIDLFNSLNTTGLDLDTKDIFKIRYYDYLKAHENNLDTIFQRINKAYLKMVDIEDDYYILNADDLLDVFRFWILCNQKDNVSANIIKGTSRDYFLGKKSKPFENKELAGLDIFLEIAKTIKDTQSRLIELDQSVNLDIVLLCAKELLRESGYWRIRNLFYIFVCAQALGKEVTDENVINALIMTQFVWRICSIYYCVEGKIVNEAFDVIINVVAKTYIKSQDTSTELYLKEIVQYLNNKNKKKNYWNNSWLKYCMDRFPDFITGDVYNSSRKKFVCFLSYLDDCKTIGNISAKSVKKKMYNQDKSLKWEIEHIASHSFYSDENIEFQDDNNNRLVNQIGNLVFLPHSINESLGNHTKTIEKKDFDIKTKCVYDFCSKISEDYKNKNYLEEDNNCEGVEQFLKYDFSKINKQNIEIAFEEIKTIINKRNNSKIEFLKSVYNFDEIFNN